jgi:hypothetical protein
VREAPVWKKGYIVNLVFVLMCWLLFLVGVLLHRRDLNKIDMERIQRDEEKLGEPTHVEETIKE